MVAAAVAVSLVVGRRLWPLLRLFWASHGGHFEPFWVRGLGVVSLGLLEASLRPLS